MCPTERSRKNDRSRLHVLAARKHTQSYFFYILQGFLRDGSDHDVSF